MARTSKPSYKDRMKALRHDGDNAPPTSPDRIQTWCRSEALKRDGEAFSPCLKLVKRHRTMADASKMADQIIEVISKAVASASEQIWNLAREYSYDPIRHDVVQMRSVLVCHVEIEVHRTTGEDLEYAESVMEEYVDAVRNTVHLTAMYRMLKTTSERSRTGIHTPPIAETLIEETLEMMTRIRARRYDAPGA